MASKLHTEMDDPKGKSSFAMDELIREISDAEIFHSDINLAFELQLKEAITSSLSFLPSSSSHPPPITDNIVYVTNEVDEVGVVYDYMSLLLEDIERVDQERRDREACERLMLEMRMDLDRRIHDQKLANDILNMPDDEWEKDGENYHRPYEVDAGWSSSFSLISELALVNSESFNVYCKGLESKEMIRESSVVVGGVGVAICDSRDNVIFEVSKGLKLDFSGKGKAVSNEEAVEIEALVEGLKAALSLDLKNITFFFDDFMVYQYVIGRVQPMETRISTLISELSLLQKQFTDCKPSLVARNDLKFAFKLARDGIVSQITWPAESDKGEKSLKETCVICYEDTNVGQMFSVDGCLHRYCFSCMRQHVEVKLLNGMEATCPHEGCKSEVNIDVCGKFLDPKLVNLMIQRKKEASIAVTEKVYCPYPRCSALMSKNEALEYTNPFFVGAEEVGARKCMRCDKFFCINCKVPWHYNLTCHEYKRSNLPPEDAMFNSLAEKKRWRQCVNCSHLVELAEGCYHMTCRCGYEFCYTCGAPWQQKRATCKCRLWDEGNIVRH